MHEWLAVPVLSPMETKIHRIQSSNQVQQIRPLTKHLLCCLHQLVCMFPISDWAGLGQGHSCVCHVKSMFPKLLLAQFVVLLAHWCIWYSDKCIRHIPPWVPPFLFLPSAAEAALVRASSGPNGSRKVSTTCRASARCIRASSSFILAAMSWRISRARSELPYNQNKTVKTYICKKYNTTVEIHWVGSEIKWAWMAEYNCTEGTREVIVCCYHTNPH